MTRPAGAFTRAFTILLALKLLNGLGELIGGAAMLFVTPAWVRRTVALLTRGELTEDPDSLIAHELIRFADHLDVSSTTFASMYLLIHGAVKSLLVIEVLRDRLWAYPWLIGALTLFDLYQVHSLITHFTWGMVALTVFDTVIIVMTIKEYRMRRRMDAEAREA